MRQTMKTSMLLVAALAVSAGCGLLDTDQPNIVEPDDVESEAGALARRERIADLGRVDSSDEIGQLGLAFNNMADRLVELQEDVKLRYEILASTPGGGIAHWHVTYQVASEELFQIWAASTGTHPLARKPGDPLPRLVLDGVLQARFEGDACKECRLWWHSMPQAT